ncbi:MAG TPA: hypothetical protein VF160_05265 [Candidatus Dormibacteraeota bacterium]
MEDRRLQGWSAAAGILGPLLLGAYFGAPALAAWPYAGASPDALVAYARSHAILFYAGGWLQATGALLSIAFFVALTHLSGRRDELAAVAVYVGGATLLAVVLVEAALLEAVPMAAANGDRITVATTFALSNGVFARIFPLAPAPLVFAGIGFALRGTNLLPGPLVTAALVIAALFVVSGIAAIFGTAGLVLAIVMSIVEAIWILASGVTLAARAWR